MNSWATRTREWPSPGCWRVPLWAARDRARRGRGDPADVGCRVGAEVARPHRGRSRGADVHVRGAGVGSNRVAGALVTARVRTNDASLKIPREATTWE